MSGIAETMADALSSGLWATPMHEREAQMAGEVAAIWDSVGILTPTAGWRYEIRDASPSQTEYDVFVATVVTPTMSGTQYHEGTFLIRRWGDRETIIWDIARYIERWA
jgi:hypothetical protein